MLKFVRGKCGGGEYENPSNPKKNSGELSFGKLKWSISSKKAPSGLLCGEIRDGEGAWCKCKQMERTESLHTKIKLGSAGA